jgi:hypothetical protein
MISNYFWQSIHNENAAYIDKKGSTYVRFIVRCTLDMSDACAEAATFGQRLVLLVGL